LRLRQVAVSPRQPLPGTPGHCASGRRRSRKSLTSPPASAANAAARRSVRWLTARGYDVRRPRARHAERLFPRVRWSRVCGRDVGDAHLPRVRRGVAGGDADRRLSVLLDLPVMWCAAAAASRRLLRILLLRRSCLSAAAGGRPRLRLSDDRGHVRGRIRDRAPASPRSAAGVRDLRLERGRIGSRACGCVGSFGCAGPGSVSIRYPRTRP
jgi:hypothetical protein